MVLWKQTSWGWMTALAMFLEGLCGATVLLGVLLGSPAGAIIGAILGALAGFVLLVEAGNPKAATRLLAGVGHAWMSRGSVLIALCIIFGLAYGLPALRVFSWLPWGPHTVLGKVLGGIAGISGVVLMLYPGLLLGSMKALPLWGSAASPIVSLIGSLLGGVGLLLLGAPLLLQAEALPTLNAVGLGLAALQILIWWSFLDTAQKGISTAASASRLLGGMPAFVWGAIIAGLLVPLILMGVVLLAPGVSARYALSTIAGLLLMVGWFCQRYAILEAGIRVPMYPIRI